MQTRTHSANGRNPHSAGSEHQGDAAGPLPDRAEKILSLAAGHIDGQAHEKDEIKKMLPAERGMFETVTSAISQAREALVAQVTSGPPTGGHREEEAWQDEGAAGAAPDAQAQAPEQGYVVARVLETMEPFMGVDGRIYQL